MNPASAKKAVKHGPERLHVGLIRITYFLSNLLSINKSGKVTKGSGATF
jgi:hypothetical protein